MSAAAAPNSEFEMSRPVDVQALTHGETRQSLRATADECEALAKRFSINRLQHLNATLTLTRSGSGKNLRIKVQGSLDAKIEQTCVISLEPFTSRITSDFEAVFDARADQEESYRDLDPLAEDPPEPIVDGHIDLGELVAQCLGLEIDPHPRKPGVEAEFSEKQTSRGTGEEPEPAAESPFAALKNLKFDSKD